MKDSHIQWTDHTFNPWEGCTKVSPGCLNCYAETRNKRFADGANWGKGAPRRRTVPSNWRGPVQWNRAAMEAINDYETHKTLHGGEAHYDCPKRPRVFCASLADWLDDEVPIEWLADLLCLIFDTSFLDWQLLTKRPENWKKRIVEATTFIQGTKCLRDPLNERWFAITGWLINWVDGKAPNNVWIGTSVEDQTRANTRVPLMLAIPEEVHFLSCEPLLGAVDLTRVDTTSETDPGFNSLKLDPEAEGDLDAIVNWVIVGGESGANSRQIAVSWIEGLIFQCKANDCPVFVKQLGSRPFHDFAGYLGSNIDRSLHLKHPKGGEIEEWPERFRVREFPKGCS